MNITTDWENTMNTKRTFTAEGPLRRLALGFADYRRRRRDYERLREMPDSLLEDIGVTRHQVNAAKWRPLI